MRRIVIALALLLSSSLHAADFVLVDLDEGVPPAPIVVAADAPPRSVEAAHTLAEYVGRICGERPTVITSLSGPLPDRSIWVGVQPRVERLLPQVDLTFQHPEETLLAANERCLLLAGRDRWDPAHTEAKGRLAPITGRQQEYGTANAVYTLLQELLGVRWLWPGDLGTDVPHQQRIVIPAMAARYHPQFRARSGLLKFLSLGDTKEGEDELWARYQRLQLDSLELLAGHGFPDWWDKYHTAHPDYFALQPDGTRSGYPSPHNAKLCESNPAVWQQWLADVVEALAADPTRRVFNASENDGYNAGHCVCERCRAWDQPGGDLFPFVWQGVKEDRPAVSDRQVTFANHLARLLKDRFPGRELYVQLHAYGFSRPAPQVAVPDDHVIITSVANYHLRGDGGGEDRTQSMAQMAAWSDKASHLMWRPNLGNPVGLAWGMPDVSFQRTAEDFRFAADHHGSGLFFDMIWMFWATQGPYYYLIAQLAWNPYLDADALLQDYYQRGFGPAAEPVQAYWELLEKTRMDFVANVPNRYRAFDIPQVYTPALLDQAAAYLDAADRLVAGAEPIYTERVAFVRRGLEYTRLLVAIRAAMQRYEASQLKDEEAKAEVLALWDQAGRMAKTFPEFAVNWVNTFSKPPAPGADNKRLMGLHPNVPLSGHTLREKVAIGAE